MKRTMIVILLLLVSIMVYVLLVNRDSKNMTTRQKFLKAFYPALMWLGNLKPDAVRESNLVKAPVSFFTLQAMLNNGSALDFSALKGKKLLIVNTASDCGYTNQLTELEQLHQQNKDHVMVIGFPSNDFKEQEKGTDDEIASFCKTNYGVSFTLMKKGIVLKKPGQLDVYKWLSDKNLNGWNDKAPKWNFCKYIIDENGNLSHFFGPSVRPSGKEIANALNPGKK